MTWTIHTGDCLEVMRQLPDNSVDLVMCSPPYEAARTYGVGFKLRGQDWIDWAFERYMECVRVCKGLVVWNCEGQTRNFQWSATPALLMADLHRAGVKLRKPPIFHRVGVPGSGGPDWLRNDYEFCVCSTKGRLPWSDNTAMGHPPKWAPGGEMSNRLADGARVNQWGHSVDSGATVVDDGGVVRSKGQRPSHVVVNGRNQWGGTGHATGMQGRNANGQHKKRFPATKRAHTKFRADGTDETQFYGAPAIANPGNVIQQTYTADEVANLLSEASDVSHHLVGGGVMGDALCHENEAPYPESLPEFFVRSFCPPGGTVLDPFCGSGTTIDVAVKFGRNAIGIDLRESQAELTRRRMANVQRSLLTG